MLQNAKQRLLAVILFIQARSKEPSTAAGATALLALLHKHVDPGMVQNVIMAAAFVTGTLAMFLKENS